MWEKEIFQINDDVAEPASASLMVDFLTIVDVASVLL